jgi:AcrR family transcriptional regulator
LTPDRESRIKLLAEKRREQILKAALEVFSRNGYSAATIPAIAKSAGIAAGTIYLYYPSKRDLFVGVIESMMVVPLTAIFDQGRSLEFQVTLEDALRDRLRFVQSGIFPQFLSLMSEIQRDPELRTLFVSKLIRPLFSRMEEFYSSRIRSGEIRQIDPALAVRLVASIMMGMTMLKSLEQDSSPVNKIPPDKLAGNIRDFILHGFMKENPKDEH